MGQHVSDALHDALHDFATLEVMAFVVIRVFVLHLCTVRRPSHSEDMTLSVSALIGLVTLTFDHLTSK